MSYKPKCLGHINIFVRNAARAREWYEDVLGLHTYDLRPDAAFMAAGIATVAVMNAMGLEVLQ